MFNVLVSTEREEDKIPVTEWLKKYRGVARKMFGIITLADAASAKISDMGNTCKITPKGLKSKQILEILFDKEGFKKRFYALREFVRDELLETAHSYVWDSIREDVTSAYSAIDPYLLKKTGKKMSRQWLILNGARRLARFHSLPLSVPKLTGAAKLYPHCVEIVWDNVLGPIKFKIDRLDPVNWATWQKIVSGEWPHGTIKLNEWERTVTTDTRNPPTQEQRKVRVHQLRLSIPYEKPESDSGLNPSRTMTAEITPDGFVLKFSEDTRDSIGFEHAFSGLNRYEARKNALEARRRACGSPVMPWGDRHGWGHEQVILDRVTFQREGFVKDVNHAWSRRIASRAESWNCGAVKVVFPKPSEEVRVGRFPWAWFQFKQFVEYKVKELGGSIEFVEPKPEPKGDKSTK